MSLQFVQALSKSIQAVTGSAADVSVIGVFPGSNASAVTVVTSVAFPDWSTANSGSLQAYLAALSSPKPTSIYGSQFAGISVDKSSIQISYVAVDGKHFGLLQPCYVAGPACSTDLCMENGAQRAHVHVCVCYVPSSDTT